MLPTGRRDLPLEVVRRAQDRRANLPKDSVEHDPSDAQAVSSSTAAVLCVNVLPADQTALVEQLSSWREALPSHGELFLIERTRPAVPSALSAMRSLAETRLAALRGTRTDAPISEVVGRDVVSAVRSAGWTIASIERIELDEGDGEHRWVDLRAIDLRTRVAEEGRLEPEAR